MIINRKENDDKRRVDKIQPGCVFEYRQDFYILTNEVDREELGIRYLAVDLCSGDTALFAKDEIVRYIEDATLSV